MSAHALPPQALESAFQRITTALQHQRLVSTFDVLSAVLFTYDYLLAFDLEVRHIWRTRWTFVKILYVVQRYLPFVDSVGFAVHHQFAGNLSPQYCDVVYKATGVTYAVGILLSEMLLAIRLWAVWGKSSLASLVISLYFVGCWAPAFVLFARFLKSMTFSPFPGRALGLDFDFHGCFLTGGDDILYLCWLLLAVCDVGNLVMISIPGARAFRMGGRSELVKTVYRDGVIYYVAVAAVSVANVVTVFVLPPDMCTLLTSVSRDLHSILASRAFLSVRQIAFESKSKTDSSGQAHALSPRVIPTYPLNLGPETNHTQEVFSPSFQQAGSTR